MIELNFEYGLKYFDFKIVEINYERFLIVCFW